MGAVEVLAAAIAGGDVRLMDGARWAAERLVGILEAAGYRIVKVERPRLTVVEGGRDVG